MIFTKKKFDYVLVFFFPTLLLITLLFFKLEGSNLKNINCLRSLEYNNVLKESELLGKPILLYFHKNDNSLVKVQEETLGLMDFQSIIQDHFIYMDIDWSKKDIDKEANSQDKYFKEVFSIYQTPCLLIIDFKEQQLLRLSSENIAFSNQLVDDLLKVKNQIIDLNLGLEKLSTLSNEQLKELYLLAEKLGQVRIKNKILSQGVKEATPFFLLEQFKFFVSQNALKSDECILVKKALENDMEAFFTATLIEFQELSKQFNEKDFDLAIVTAPLKNYLNKFGDVDLEKTWRIEMILAQLYVEFDLWNSALEHAEIAFNTAPKEVKDEISRSLEYIRLNS